MPPLIWGNGTGDFNKASQQIPQLIRHAIKERKLEYVAPGTSRIGHVHVQDLALLFETVVIRAIQDPTLESGRKGFFFANTGNHSWLEVSEKIARIGFQWGVLKSAEATPLNLTAAAEKFWEGDLLHTERVQASTSVTSADRSFGIGWKPQKSEEDWQESIPDAVKKVIDENKHRV
ncbi:hypothetical protein G7Z17_g1259 [Cylindrodendrum hubeiense]|uniref:NAD-dependent epimerase/dehydratase domain-containing protein n=1 Tax=Cylindrodendrum hubeiense TaxID=595255 RepID=A0A9P5HK25_9HYPO|nr:hypothetical protein G7Z17_g1259 [Cylindrodendrum hubeiense]